MSGDPFGEIDSLLDDLDQQSKMLSEFDDIDNILRDNNLLDADLFAHTEHDDESSPSSTSSNTQTKTNTQKIASANNSTSASASSSAANDDDLPSATLMRGVTFVAPGMPRLAPVPIADKATSVVVNQRRNKRSLAMSTAVGVPATPASTLPTPQKVEISVVAAPAQRAQLATVELLSQPKKATALIVAAPSPPSAAAAKVQPSLPPKSEESRASMVRTPSSAAALTSTAAAGADDDDSSTDSTGDDNPDICTLLYSSEAGKHDQVRAATFNRQIETMLDSSSAVKGINEFLRTYRAFSSTDQLVHLLRARFIATGDDGEGKKRQLRILAIVNLLLAKHWDHLQHNSELIDDLRTFFDTMEQLGVAAPAQQLRRRLDKMVAESSSSGALPRASSFNSTTRTTFSEPPPLPRLNDMSVLDQKVPEGDAADDGDGDGEVFVLHVLKWHPEEIARQLTLLEYELYRRVQLPELMNQNWTRAAAHELSPNLTTLIAHFNRISQWVQTTILRHIDAKLRARIVTHFIEVAKYLAALQNYDGVMQFMAAFQSASVSRLKKTWAAQSKATLAELTRLKDLLSPQSSFAKLRDALRSANPPAVPYVGMYLADLTFIDEGNEHTVAHEKPLPPGRRRAKAKAAAAGGETRPRDKLRDGLCRKYTLLNTQKFRMIASVLNNFEQYQLAPYNLRPIPVLQYMLRQLRYIEDERRMYALSLAIETRNDSSADASALEQWEREDDSGTALVTSGDQGVEDETKSSSLMLVKQLSRTGLARSKSAFDKLKVGSDRGSSHTSLSSIASPSSSGASPALSGQNGADGNAGGGGGGGDDDDDAYDSGDEAIAPPAGDAWAAEGEQVLKTGFMRKKGGLRHNWTERWFVLTTSALTYFASRSDTQAKGRIMLRDATLGQVKDKGAISVDMLLGVHFQGRTYVLECKDKASKAKWVEVLSSAIDSAKKAKK